MARSRSLVLAEFVSLLLCASAVRSPLCGEVLGAMSRHFGTTDAVYDTPRAVDAYSACHGMHVTCCAPKLEKQTIPLVQASFLNDLQSVLDEVFGASCSRIGRHFSRGLFETLSDAKEILTNEVRGAFHVDPEHKWRPFDQFFDFLQEFQYTQNFCMLNQTIVGTIKELVSFSIENHKLPEKINGTRVLNHFVSVWWKKVHRSLLGYLYYLRNLEQTLDAANAVLQETRQHQFLAATPCSNAIMRKYYCGLCSGHITTTPCDGNCINTFRGCFADVAEVRPLLKDFSDQLQRFAMLSMSDLHPMSFVEGALMDYIWLAHQVMDSDFVRISEDALLPNEAIARKPLPLGHDRLNFSNPHKYRHHLQDAFNEELQCIAKTADGLLEIPERMCGINPKHLEYIRNIDCWNGTAQGSYKEALIGHMINDQLHNPSFTNEEQQVLGHRSMGYQQQISKLNQSLAEIKKYVRLYDCLASNDEDCGVIVRSVCTHEAHEGGVEPSNIIPTDIEPPEDLVSGSGSGYANTNYAYSGDGDNEEVTMPTQVEEFDTYDPVTKIHEHVFLVKMIPPFIRDGRNDIQTIHKPTKVSPTESRPLPSIKDIVRPTKHTYVEPSNQNIPDYPRPDTENDRTPQGANKGDEEDDIIKPDSNIPDSEFLLNNPSGSSSSFLSCTASLILLSSIFCTILQFIAF